MDEVLEKFEAALISHEPSESKTSFDGLYKNWGKGGSQEERRKELLENQKIDRHSKLDRFRGILEIVNDIEDNDVFENDKRVYYKPKIYVAGFHRVGSAYNNVLMLSEWMIEKPKDFNENWYVSPCPKGTRALVVASHGTTKCYSKFGHFLYECRTDLPGGNTSDAQYRNHCCVLDCFYQEKTNTMYILDLLALNNQPMTDGETEFRHYWMQTHLSEISGLDVISKRNQLKFIMLPKVDCTQEAFNEFMMTFPHFENNSPRLDGLLFYHKKAHYVAGKTPLVGWLYPYMVAEVLGFDITIHEVYLMEKPVDYRNQADFIEKFDAKYTNAKSKTRKNFNSMDTTDINNENQVVKSFNEKKKRKSIQKSEASQVNKEENPQSMDAETTPSDN